MLQECEYRKEKIKKEIKNGNRKEKISTSTQI